MDALAALSVASSVIQFVDFGSKLLSNSRKIYSSAQGVLTENVDIETITMDLVILTQGLKRKLPQNRLLPGIKSTAGEISGDDKALDRLCERCIEIGEELLKRLHKLKVDPNDTKPKESEEKSGTARFRERAIRTVMTETRNDQNRNLLEGDDSKAAGRPNDVRFRKWESFRKALEVSWDKKEIEELVTTLREFRGEIEFRMLVSFRNTIKELAVQQTQTSQQCAQSAELVLNTFIGGRNELANQLRLQSEKILEIQAMLEKKEQYKPQTIEDFLRGELRAVGTLQPEKDDPRKIFMIKNARDSQIEEELRLLMIEQGILGSLSFATLTDRQESVEIAYSQTYGWIYESGTACSNFIDWLRHGNGIYWISGKAGSGKSTLMRYIYENERTSIELQEWAGSIQVEKSGFFFWNSGDEEQKSQRGLLRSLLFEILNRHRNLVSEVLPEAWEAWSSRAIALITNKLPLDSPFLPQKPKPWTMTQLRQAFRRLLKSFGHKVKLCLFIDGLDEYEGDYDDIVNLVEEFALSPNLKICLSSRPLMVFERAFAGLPMLRLQNLTHRDIDHYVKDKLYKNKYMIQLSKQHTAEVSNLVNEIVEKASGVFLWVKLVVKSLLYGLRDYNRISDLKKRVRHLPADLEALYAHMLKHTDPFYYEQASQIFQIVQLAQKRSPEKVTLLNLSWADDEDDTLAERAPMQPLTSEEISMRCKAMDARLKSVCVGLLESIDTKFSSNGPDAKVQFLHRTVSDWFRNDKVWEQLLSHTAGTGFSPNLSMLKSCILRLKSLEANPALPLDMSIILNALQYAKEAESELNYGFPKLLDQLDIAASYQWRIKNANRTHTDSISKDEDISGDESSLEDEESSEDEDIFEDAVSTIQGRSFVLRASLTSETIKNNFKRILAHPLPVSCALPEEGVLHHWSYGLEIPGIKPAGQTSTFYKIARDMGLDHYVNIKYQSGVIVDQDVNQHLLANATMRVFGSKGTNRAIDPALIERTLVGGANPNFSYAGMTPWESVLNAAVSHFVLRPDGRTEQNFSADSDWKRIAEDWARVFECFLRHGADLNARSERHQELPGHPRLSPLIVVEKYFSGVLPEEAARLKVLLKQNEAEYIDNSETRDTNSGNMIEKAKTHETSSKIKGFLSWIWF